jgi:hypothetical protein
MIRTIFDVFLDAGTFIALFQAHGHRRCGKSVFRKQLGLFIERRAKPRRATDAIRFTLARLSCLFDWRNALTENVIRHARVTAGNAVENPDQKGCRHRPDGTLKTYLSQTAKHWLRSS